LKLNSFSHFKVVSFQEVR